MSTHHARHAMGRAIRSLPAWAKVAISGLAVTSVSFGALASAGAATSTAIPSGTIHGCIYVTSNRTLERVYTNPTLGTTCPTGTVQVIWSIKGPQGPQGPPGPPGPSELSATATTAVSNRDDSGAAGNWATDAFTRVVTVTRHGAVGVGNCGGGAVSCYYYTAALADNGSFATVPGASTPNQNSSTDSTSDGKIQGNVTGTLTGGSKIEFYAGSADGSWDGAPNAGTVAATVSGDTPSTTNWVKQFFPNSTIFTTPQLLNWSWTYSAPNTCETWVDAFDNGDGNQAADGNIAGNNKC